MAPPIRARPGCASCRRGRARPGARSSPRRWKMKAGDSWSGATCRSTASVLAAAERASLPHILQVFALHQSSPMWPAARQDRSLYRARVMAETRLAAAGMDGAAIVSLSLQNHCLQGAGRAGGSRNASIRISPSPGSRRPSPSSTSDSAPTPFRNGRSRSRSGRWRITARSTPFSAIACRRGAARPIARRCRTCRPMPARWCD